MSIDLFQYFGSGTLVCKSSSTLDEGKTVEVTNGKRTWRGIITNGECMFKMLPNKEKYTVNLVNGEIVEYTTTVIFGFGDYKEIDVGLDKTTWKGLKAIVNAGLHSKMLAVGDQISAVIGGETQVFDIVHIDYRAGVYGRNIVLAKHTCLASTKQMQTSNTNAGGYKATLISKFLDNDYFNSLPEDMKSVITPITFQASIGSQNSGLQNEDHKIFIPLEYNVFGATTHAAATEVTLGGAEQFAYFATAANRVKTLGDTGSACVWWLCSPYVGNSTAFCIVTAAGSAGGYSASNSGGVLPCFLIAEDPVDEEEDENAIE